MNGRPAIERTSAAKAGWVVLLLMGAWLIFVFVPWPSKTVANKASVKLEPPSKLAQVGLPDNVDWDGLPEIFAIWADRAEWKDGRTRFAYWHPVMKTYSYYFEAVQVDGSVRFREIPEPRESGYEWDEALGEECPIRFYRKYAPAPNPSRIETMDPLTREQVKLRAEITSPKTKVPQPGVLPVDLESKR